MNLKLSIAVMVFLSVSGSLGTLYAQDEAFMIPKSDHVIKGELELPDGSKVKFAVRDGQWVTVEDRRAGYFFGFSGGIDERTSVPNFLLYELTRVKDDTKAREIPGGLFNIPVGKSHRYPMAKNILLSVKGTEEWQFATAPLADPSQYSPSELKELFGSPETGDGLCCLSCNQRTICASAVETSCGSCGGGGGGGFEAI
jgi:hypothetical protein